MRGESTLWRHIFIAMCKTCQLSPVMSLQGISLWKTRTEEEYYSEIQSMDISWLHWFKIPDNHLTEAIEANAKQVTQRKIVVIIVSSPDSSLLYFRTKHQKIRPPSLRSVSCSSSSTSVVCLSVLAVSLLEFWWVSCSCHYFLYTRHEAKMSRTRMSGHFGLGFVQVSRAGKRLKEP